MVDPHASWLERLKASPRLHEAGWVLLPLRLFLGVTFVYAGLQKLTDPTYFNFSSPNSVRSQMLALAASSPIGPLVRESANFATLTGLAIAFGELAVGLGVLLGLWTRLAALGGVLLSVSFFLTVSWNTRPYFLGSDIVFIFAWTPLLIAGDDGVLSIVTAVRRSVRHGMNLPAEPDRRERPAVTAEVQRRTVVRSAGIAGFVAAVAAMVGGLTAVATHRRAGLGTLAANTPAGTTPSAAPTVTTTTTAGATAGGTAPGTKIASTASVSVGGAQSFTDTKDGQPAFVVQPTSGQFKAFSAICTHAGCTVGFSGGVFACPCHGAQYDAATGAVLSGPAPSPLPSIPIVVSNGTIYET
jgi:thiosulfate dehydrogenase (quinone) large subunit